MGAQRRRETLWLGRRAEGGEGRRVRLTGAHLCLVGKALVAHVDVVLERERELAVLEHLRGAKEGREGGVCGVRDGARRPQCRVYI